MNFIDQEFLLDLIKSLGGHDSINCFGRILDVAEIIPKDSNLYLELIAKWKIHKHFLDLERFDYLKKLRENRQRFSELSNYFNKSEVIPFLGAGMSIPSGLLGWEQLLYDLSLEVIGPRNIQSVRKLIASGEYEDAADEIYRHLKKNTFNERLENRYRILSYSEIVGDIKLVTSMFPNNVITTNFDNIIETIIKYENPDVEFKILNGIELKEFDVNHILRTTNIIKLHGDFKIPASRILLKSEYDRAYGDASFIGKIKDIAYERTILFLGCSLNKDRYLENIKTLKRRQTYNRRNYTILRSRYRRGDRDFHSQIDREERKLNAMNVYPIWVEEYSDIQVILRDLLSFHAEEVELNDF